MPDTDTLDPEIDTPDTDEESSTPSRQEEENKKSRPSIRSIRNLQKNLGRGGSGAPKTSGPSGGAAGTGGGAGGGGAEAVSGLGGAGSAAGAGAAGAGAGGAGAAAGGAAAGGAAAGAPVLLIVLAVVLVIVVILLIILIIINNSAALNTPLTITKTGPDSAQNGQTLNYKIAVSFPGSAQDITISDPIPPDTQFVSSGQPTTCDNGACNEASKVINWDIKNINPPDPTTGLMSNINTTLDLTLKATADNKFLVNQAQGVVIGEVKPVSDGGGNGGGGGSDDNCGGKYATDMAANRFLKKNFGDPTCELTGTDHLDKIYNEIKQQDPANADWWFHKVLPCESGYDPNSWYDPNNVPHSPDAGGPWGLFQDGSSAILKPEDLYTNSRYRRDVTTADIVQPPGLAIGIWGHGGLYDRGDVSWRTQISNAVQLLKVRGRAYWACA